MSERWEIERDRFGLHFNGPLEVGECREVVPAAEADQLREALRETKAILWGLAGDYLEAMGHLGGDPASVIESRREALGDTPDE